MPGTAARVDAPCVAVPARRVAIVAAVVFLAQAGMIALAPALADERSVALPPALGFVSLAIIAGLAWLVAVPWIGAVPERSAIGFGALIRALWLASPPALDTDHLRYLWDGALAAHGLSPWGAAPAAGVPAALGAEGVALASVLPFAGLRTIYPVTAQAAFLGAHLIAPWSLVGLRVVMLAAEAAGLVAARVLAHRARLPVARALVWWCCPLSPLLFVNAVHVDALLPPLLFGALAATLAGRAVTAGVLVGLAAGVKLWPVLLVPLLWRSLPERGRSRFVPAAAAVSAAAVAPLLATVAAPEAGLAAYAAGWAVNNAPFAWASVALGTVLHRPEVALRPLAALAAVGVSLWAASSRPDGGEALCRRAMIVSAAVFYLSPAQFPWYAAWFMPFAALLAFRPLLLPAATLPSYWLFHPLHLVGLGGLFTHGVAALHALPVALALALRWR
jgi:hypothetical protein